MNRSYYNKINTNLKYQIFINISILNFVYSYLYKIYNLFCKKIK